MKRVSTLLALAALVAGPALATAQNVSASGTVNYKAEYLSTGALAFGAFDPGVAQLIETSSASRGYIGVRFNSKSVVTFTSSGTLSQQTDGQGNDMTADPDAGSFTPTYSCGVLDDNGSVAAYDVANTTILAGTSSATCFSGNTVSLTLSNNRRTTRWVVLGGSISAAASQDMPAGSYAGTLTISIAKSAT